MTVLGMLNFWDQIVRKYHQIAKFPSRLIVSRFTSHRFIKLVAAIDLMYSQMMKVASHRFIRSAINHKLMLLMTQKNLGLREEHHRIIKTLQLTVISIQIWMCWWMIKSQNRSSHFRSNSYLRIIIQIVAHPLTQHHLIHPML